MNFISEHEKILIYRLKKKGLTKKTIPGCIGTLKQCLLDEPNMNHWQANKRLQFLGWDDVDLDYHTLQLDIACFEVESFKRSVESSAAQNTITGAKI